MSSEIPQEVLDKADALKKQGNDAYVGKHYDKAIHLYSDAIDLNPENSIYFCNRAACYLKTELYGAALNDATRALELNPDYTKARYRLGAANLALGNAKESLKDFKEVAKQHPQDRVARSKLQQCEKIVRQMKFAEAFSDERSDRGGNFKGEWIDPAKIDVDSAYDGPRCDGEITLEFVNDLMKHFEAGKKLHKKYAYTIIVKAHDVLKQLPSLVDVPIPESEKFTVCGDVHGQFYDLLNIFKLNGLPSEDNPYLFNGDFVDRGSWSVEIILTLLAFKCANPKAMHLTRGNHETQTMNMMYGFTGEVKHKFEENMSHMFDITFNALPLTIIIESKIMVCHGGLFSKDGVKLEDIKKINRFCQPPDSGIMSELLWSDPQEQPGRGPSKRGGVGVCFGPDITAKFLEENNLDLLVRSHECKEEGYEVTHNGKLITIFSAPNYCDQMGNKGAFITFGKSLKPEFTQFSAVPHPNIGPMAYASMGNFLQSM